MGHHRRARARAFRGRRTRARGGVGAVGRDQRIAGGLPGRRQRRAHRRDRRSPPGVRRRTRSRPGRRGRLAPRQPAGAGHRSARGHPQPGLAGGPAVARGAAVLGPGRGLPAGAGPRFRVVRRARLAAGTAAARSQRLVRPPVRELRASPGRRLARAVLRAGAAGAGFGERLGAERVEIWPDVPGMFSANRREVPEARLLTRLDYAEAQEIATTGAKVLHPRAIGPCREARVPMAILDTARPELPGTTIAAAAEPVPGVKAISRRNGIVLVSMETVGMWQQVGFLADVFERFRRHGLSVDLIGSSETNVTVSLDPSDNLVSGNVLEALSADLAEVCRVKVIVPCAAITLVGRGMRSLLHRLSDVWATFGQERVHLISQSSNDLNLTFVVDEADADGLVPLLHEELVRSGAMPMHDARVFGPSWHEIAHGRRERAEPWWARHGDRLLALAARGTPRYAYHLGTLRERARAISTVEAIDQRYYAVKANPHPALLRALAAEG